MGVGDRIDKESFVQVTLDKEKTPKFKKKSVTRLMDTKIHSNERKSVKKESVIIKSSGYTVVVQENKAYLWGNISNQIYTEPVLISDLSSIQIKDISLSDSFAVVLSSLNNLGSIRYSNFDPPVVGSGTFEGLVKFIFDENSTEKFTEILLFTYPEFSNHTDFLNALTKLFENFVKNPNSQTDINNAQK